MVSEQQAMAETIGRQVTRLGGHVVSPPGDAIRFEIEREHAPALLERLGSWDVRVRPAGTGERIVGGTVPRIVATDCFVIALPKPAAAPASARTGPQPIAASSGGATRPRDRRQALKGEDIFAAVERERR
jgi:hypothetical protein